MSRFLTEARLAPCATTSTSSPRPGRASGPTSTSLPSPSSAGSAGWPGTSTWPAARPSPRTASSSWEFDVLAALRRAGAPYELSPGRLLRETLVTSGTMTNRVDRLAARGLVERYPDPDDRRGVIVRLTPEGKATRRRRVRGAAGRRARLARRSSRADRNEAGRAAAHLCSRRTPTRGDTRMDDHHYLIRGGIEGRERLRVLARVMRPTTLPLLERAGVTAGMRCLDVGCGGGDVTLRPGLARRDHRSVVGVDLDATKIELARGDAEQAEVTNVEFRVGRRDRRTRRGRSTTSSTPASCSPTSRPGGRRGRDGAGAAARRPADRRGHRLRRLLLPPGVRGVPPPRRALRRRRPCATAATPTSAGGCR